MFDTSKDILFIVLAFAALWVAIFLCWALYYGGKILKNANEMVEEVRERASRVDEAVRAIRQRLESMSGAFSVVAQGIAKLVGRVIDKKMEHDEDDDERDDGNDFTHKRR